MLSTIFAYKQEIQLQARCKYTTYPTTQGTVTKCLMRSAHLPCPYLKAFFSLDSSRQHHLGGDTGSRSKPLCQKLPWRRPQACSAQAPGPVLDLGGSKRVPVSANQPSRSHRIFGTMPWPMLSEFTTNFESFIGWEM